MMGLEIGCSMPPPCYGSPFHIGVVLAENFAEYAHQPSQKYTDSFDGLARARDNIKWVIAKGDLVETNARTSKTLKVVTKMSQPGHRPGSVTIVLSSSDRRRAPPTEPSQCGECRLHRIRSRMGEATQTDGVS